MIARYSRPEMANLWTDRERLLLWLRVEFEVCKELAGRGEIPRSVWKTLRTRLERLERAGGVDPKRVLEIENEVKHDVIAFTTAVAEKVGPTSRYVHYGLTSSDVVDTALSIQLGRAGKQVLSALDGLRAALKQQALKTKKTATIGRSHGMHAEPTAFGLKFLGAYAEMTRNRHRIARALEQLRVGKLSGAVGSNPHFGVTREKKILRALGLKREPVSTQVLPRDRHAELMSMFAVTAGGIERLAVELRHLQRSEVAEVYEGFSKGQKGSSAMPHKRNPISSENLTGCARLLRAYASASLENIALWHERDISHSSVERVALSDSFILLDYALSRMTRVVEGLEIDTARVEKNLKSAGEKVFSGHLLLALVQAGVSREQGYRWIQECALTGISSASHSSFLERLQAHSQISKALTSKQISTFVSLDHQLRNVDAIYKAVWSDPECG
jgi:adenylosuccinate lyase